MRRFLEHRRPTSEHHPLQCDMLILKCSPCTTVMQYITTSNDCFFLPQFLLSCCSHAVSKIWVRNPRVAFLALKASVVLSARVVSVVDSRSS